MEQTLHSLAFPPCSTPCPLPKSAVLALHHPESPGEGKGPEAPCLCPTFLAWFSASVV